MRKGCIQLNNEVIIRGSSVLSLHLQVIKHWKSLKLSGHNQRNLKENENREKTPKNANRKMTYIPPLYKCNSHEYHYSLSVYTSSFSISFEGIPQTFDS